MKLVAIAMLGATAAVAAADPATDVDHVGHAVVSLPLELGGDLAGGLVVGIRPELLYARIHSDDRDELRPGWGVGGYGELLHQGGDGSVGAGATFVHYGTRFSIAPSLGVYERNPRDRGASISLFAGKRGWARMPRFDVPAGARVEARFDQSGERAVVVTLQCDVVTPGVLFVAALDAMFRHGG